MSRDLCATMYSTESIKTQKKKISLYLKESTDLFLVGVHVDVFAVLLWCSLSVGNEAVSRSSLAISRLVLAVRECE